MRYDVRWGGQGPVLEESGGRVGAEDERSVEIDLGIVVVIVVGCRVCDAPGCRGGAEAGVVVEVDVVVGGEAGG